LRRAHLGRDGNNEVIPEEAANFPPLAQVLQKRLALELRQNVDGINAGVDKIAKDEVDDSVAAAKWDCRFCAFFGKRIEARSLSACEHKCENPKLHPDNLRRLAYSKTL
jgi:hypothetical protein